jgi:rubredoxin
MGDPRQKSFFPEAGPIPMLLWCPLCKKRHIDKGDFATRPHHTHACQSCGHVWRPAVVETVGVKFLPGFKDSKEGSE